MTIMSLGSPPPTLFFFLLLLLCAAGTTAAGASSPSAYEVLQSYDFPVGLLPQGILGYDLDESTGRFSARLNGSCSFSLEGSYQLRYKDTIAGYISKGRLRDLRGVSVKVLFFWVNIVEVTRRGDDLEFSVGIASADFSIDNFLQCPQCGCGIDCISLPSSSSSSSSEEKQSRRLGLSKMSS